MTSSEFVYWLKGLIVGSKYCDRVEYKEFLFFEEIENKLKYLQDEKK